MFLLQVVLLPFGYLFEVCLGHAEELLENAICEMHLPLCGYDVQLFPGSLISELLESVDHSARIVCGCRLALRRCLGCTLWLWRWCGRFGGRWGGLCLSRG